MEKFRCIWKILAGVGKLKWTWKVVNEVGKYHCAWKFQNFPHYLSYINSQLQFPSSVKIFQLQLYFPTAFGLHFFQFHLELSILKFSNSTIFPTKLSNWTYLKLTTNAERLLLVIIWMMEHLVLIEKCCWWIEWFPQECFTFHHYTKMTISSDSSWWVFSRWQPLSTRLQGQSLPKRTKSKIWVNGVHFRFWIQEIFSSLA